MFAPILITVYDRILKLKSCINSLLWNKEAEKTDLFIAIDFPYREEDEIVHKKIIEFCKEIKGFKSINLIIREYNLGPHKNMCNAIIELLSIYPYLISLEDDNIVSSNFLTYINKALRFYEEDERIHSITGYNYPIKIPLEYKNICYLWTGFNGYGNGWWRSKFTLSYLQYNNFEEFLTDDQKLQEFFSMANHILPIIFSGLKKGLIYGDAALSYNYFLNKKYQLYPVISKVRNIGYDGSGVNCGCNLILMNQKIDNGSGKIEFMEDIQPDERIYKILSEYFRISEMNKTLLEKEIDEYKKKYNIINKKKDSKVQLLKDNFLNIPECPLNNKKDVILEKKISTSFLINAYKQSFNIDVNKYFGNLEYISVYRCIESGYRFYYPFDVAGDSEFYEALQSIPWYYMDWKWEYDKAIRLLIEGKNLLEIGCGKGNFIEYLAKEGISCTGLELNIDTVKKLRRKGLNVLAETIEEHSKYNFEKYDMIVSFQVLEHVADVNSFIKNSLFCLKPNGKLILSVPNHDAFIGLDEFGILDMPPHHMGLWNEKSLKYISTIFNLKIENVFIEPLQSYHIDYYINIMKRVIQNDFNLHNTIEELARKFPEKIKGHTILVEYLKL